MEMMRNAKISSVKLNDEDDDIDDGKVELAWCE